MSKVYVLGESDYSSYAIIGIYSTREKADAAKVEYERPYRAYGGGPDDPLQKNTCDGVLEVELDTVLYDNFPADLERRYREWEANDKQDADRLPRV